MMGVTSVHSGVSVIVVGMGLGGLATAIECQRRGHSVIMFDKMTEIREIGGDGIGIGSNAARIISQWGDGAIDQAILAQGSDTTHLDMHDHHGRYVASHMLHGYGRGSGYMQNRGRLIRVLYEYAAHLPRIDIRLGTLVEDYWETESVAGVTVYGPGGKREKVEADCVICSDGVHSLGRAAIVGQDTRGVPMGWATFRGHLPCTHALIQDPETRWVVEVARKQDIMMAYTGGGMQFSFWTLRHGEELVWILTHPDPKKRARETWVNGEALVEDAADCIASWPARTRIAPIIRKTSPHKIINQAITIRPPLNTWRSSRGRMMVIGDAAHPYFPIMGQGGGQAIEDGAVIAIALELAGKANVCLALQVAEKIRYPRATVIQQGCSALQEAAFNPDWEAVRKDPSILSPPSPDWIFAHDCQAYTYREFNAVVQALQEKREYVATNIPPEGVYIR
ncbi:hypothetical protein BJX96DRAFT_152058 [Aspergillus floccosus]